ncbi:MAG: beta-galactosidase, partial [bacterium]
MWSHLSRVPLLVLAAVVVALACPSGALAAGPPPPVQLSQGWQFALDRSDRGLSENWQSGHFGLKWEPVTVPHVFDPRPLASLFKGTVGWYRIGFTGPVTAAGMGWWLRFEQVRRSARVWLNGREIAVHRDPYTPFEFPARGLLPGQPNMLVVRADNRRPPGTREGWWNWGGITRSVALVARGPVVLRDAGVMPRRTCKGHDCRWSTLVDGWLENRSPRSQQAAVRLSLRSPDDGVSEGGASMRTLRPGERVRVRFNVAVRGTPRLWEPEHPRLYDATVQTIAGGRVVQTDRRRIGLRTV